MRRRSDLGVTSTSSSSAMNSMDCSSVRLLVGDEAERFVGAGGAHVGELLFADGVDVEVVVAGVLADDHALVDLDAVGDEEDAAVLQAVERVGGGGAGAVGDEGAGGTLRDLALVGDVAVEDGVHHDGAAGFGEHFASAGR